MRFSRGLTILAVACECASACGSHAPTTPSQTPVPGAQTCRTFATAWVATPTFGSPQNVVASFSTASHVYTETIAGTSLLLTQTTYASTADFIDEPGALGRVLFQQTATCSNAAGCQGPLLEIEMPTYDSARRRIGSIVRVNGAPLIVDTFRQWDGLGRPTSGNRAQAGICAVPYAITYDDIARTVSEAAQPGGSILCAVGSTSRVRTYDANGNIVSESGSAGGTSTTISRAITTTQQICK